ncbi:MAG: PIN domain-containing protein [Candidatus Eremiobacteraeota bacterium]|nr:PIN domain-containing protein [Candidatus Eremiobacteraeota bacterium]
MNNVVALDSGAVLALAASERDAVTLIKGLANGGAFFVVPAPVLTETLRGTPGTDVAINRVLKTLEAVPVSIEAAVAAGKNLGRTRSASTVDAMIIATAIERGASAIVTGDPVDIAALSGGKLTIYKLY